MRPALDTWIDLSTRRRERRLIFVLEIVIYLPIRDYTTFSKCDIEIATRRIDRASVALAIRDLGITRAIVDTY